MCMQHCAQHKPRTEIRLQWLCSERSRSGGDETRGRVAEGQRRLDDRSGMRITRRRYSDFRPEEVTILILTCLFDFDQRVLDVLSSPDLLSLRRSGGGSCERQRKVTLMQSQGRLRRRHAIVRVRISSTSRPTS